MSGRILERDQLREITNDIREALAAVAKKHGMSKLEAGASTFDPRAGSFHFKVEGVVEGGMSTEQRNYEMERSFDKDLPELNTEFRDSRGSIHKVVGANKNGSALTESRGKPYVWRNRRVFVQAVKSGAVK